MILGLGRFGFRGRRLEVFRSIRNNGVKNAHITLDWHAILQTTVHSFRNLSASHNLHFGILLHRINLFFGLELIDQFGKILNIIFIVHLCKLFENHELVYRAMNLFTSCIFEFHQLFFVFVNDQYEFGQVLICLRQNLVVSGLFLIGNIDHVQHAVVETLPFLVWYICVQL